MTERGDVFFPESGAVIVFEEWVTPDRTASFVWQLAAAPDGAVLGGRLTSELDEKWFATCECLGSLSGIFAGLAAVSRCGEGSA